MFKRRKLFGAHSTELSRPALRPEYIKKALRIEKQKAIPVGSVKALRKRYG